MTDSFGTADQSLISQEIQAVEDVKLLQNQSLRQRQKYKEEKRVLVSYDTCLCGFIKVFYSYL